MSRSAAVSNIFQFFKASKICTTVNINAVWPSCIIMLIMKTTFSEISHPFVVLEVTIPEYQDQMQWQPFCRLQDTIGGFCGAALYLDLSAELSELMRN